MAELMDQYDELGNYIGPESEEDEEDQVIVQEAAYEEPEEAAAAPATSTALQVRADDEDEEVEHLHEEADRQGLDTAVIAPNKIKNFDAPVTQGRRLLGGSQATEQERSFVGFLMSNPEHVRNVALVGHLHHGKTEVCDYLLGTEGKYTDTRIDEQQRGLSLMSTPVMAVLQNSSAKSHLINFVDVPGHINLLGEGVAALRQCDGMCLVVDAVEGVMMGTDKVVQIAKQHGLALFLLISKVDRLIVELKLPPEDANVKLRHIISEVNALNPPKKISPLEGNVVFAGAKHRWSFTLQSFATRYQRFHPEVDLERLAKWLWNGPRFVEYALNPLYKIYSHVVGEEPSTLGKLAGELGIHLRREELNSNAGELMTAVLQRFFGGPSGWVDTVLKCIPNPKEAAPARVEAHYTGSQDEEIAIAMRNCSQEGPPVVFVSKLLHKSDASGFLAWGRVMAGTLRAGDRVRIMGEAYTLDDEEDVAEREATNLYLPQGRQRLRVESVPAGSWVLIDGVDAPILKTATIVSPELMGTSILKPLARPSEPVVKVSVEPLHPQDLPKMVEGLRCLQKTYPSSVTKVEESGEHVLLGAGELHMDSMLRDLRAMYAEIEVKVSDPVVAFCETVVEASSLKCFAETPNKKNRLTMVAEPWDPKKELDRLEKEGLWCFGGQEDTSGGQGNILLNDVLEGGCEKTLLWSVKDSVVQGFRWGCREGPLCDEPIRGVKFRMLDASLAAEPALRSSGQMIPTARRVLYSAFLMATPRLMEPVCSVEIQTPVDCISGIFAVLARRRGHVTEDVPKPGSPLYTVRAFVPVIDSFGLETDIRAHTQGQAFCLSAFDHWAVVPGDPLDRSITLRPLEPSPATALARDFMVKTRKRKGMSEDVSINKYFDDPMLLELSRQQEQDM